MDAKGVGSGQDTVIVLCVQMCMELLINLCHFHLYISCMCAIQNTHDIFLFINFQCIVILIKRTFSFSL